MKFHRFRHLNATEMEKLCRRNPIADPSIMATCRAVFNDVEGRGDEAIHEYALRFDGVEINEFRVLRQEFSRAQRQISRQALQALETAATNIRKFHLSQRISEESVEVQPGVRCWRESRAISSVGLYVPGGSTILPSSVLMLGIPAQIAGCSRVVLCVPPQPQGLVSPEVLAAAQIAGVQEVFKIGGAQAIAAMALGTDTVPKVEKILGPGNRWVQTAKLLATLRGVGIDMVAGPSELLVVADDLAQPHFVANDLVSQAEHGRESRVILLSTSEPLIEEVNRLVWEQTEDLPRGNLAAEALHESFTMVVESLEEALEFSNLYAPEHLILHVENPRQWATRVQCAGSVFLGPWSPGVAGDYASGTNHTLPTSGMAKAFSGVSLDSFVKNISFQELTCEGLRGLAPTLEILAELEGLEAHRRAVSCRLGKR